jgi:hypothetical protein
MVELELFYIIADEAPFLGSESWKDGEQVCQVISNQMF